MADKKITELNNITGADLVNADEFVVVDTSSDETKAITYGELKKFNGTVTAEGLTVDGSGGKLSIEGTGIDDFVTATEPSIYRTGSGGSGIFGSAGSLVIQPRTSAARNVSIATSADGVSTLRRASFVGNGDINFYDGTGTTAKFVWDASAESLTLGASAEPSVAAGELNLVGGSTTNNTAQAALSFFDGGSNDLATIKSYRGSSFSNGELAFEVAQGGDAPVEAMRIDSTGNVGIGTSSPDALLHVADSGAATDDFTALITAFRPNLTFGDNSTSSTDWQIFVDTNDMQFRYGDADTGTKLTNEAMRIDASGNVGIGTSSPSSPFHVNGGGINNVATFESNDGTANISFVDSAQTAGVFVGAKGNDFYIQAGGNEKFRVTEDGDVDMTTNGRNILMANGAGIDFSASEGGGASSSVLDDYEEGTWNPQPADSSGNDATYGARSGNYTKIGNVVTVTFFITNINTSGLTAADDFRINSLPFASKSIPNASMYSGSARLDFITFSGTSNMLISDNTDYIRIGESISGAAHDFVRVTEVASGTADVRGSITYLAE